MRSLPDIDRRTLRFAYERVLTERPDDVAQTDRVGSATFAASFERALRLGGGLSAQGLRPGEPVAVLLDNSLDAVHLWSGIGLTGLVEVPVNTAYLGTFLSHVLNDCGAQVAVVEGRFLDRLLAVADALTWLRTVVVRGDADTSGVRGRFRIVPFAELDTAHPAAPAAVDPSTLLAYMYTSGTTGESKGVLISHAHAYTYASREDAERPRFGDRMLVTLPLFHLAGKCFGVYQSLIHQVHCVLEPGFSVGGFWDVVRTHGITVTGLLGVMGELLWRQAARPDDADNPLEFTVMAPLPVNVAGFRARFGIEVAVAYGMSEIGCVLNGAPDTIVGGECGFPRAEYELRLVDPDGRDVTRGEMGELWVRPEYPQIAMAGYHNLPDHTAATVRDGWIHTGDAFRRDEQGRYYFADRLKDALRRRGENISSFEVERVIDEFPGVAESAVLAVPSELTEDDILAVVVPAPGRDHEPIDPAELIRFLMDRLPYFMVPRYIEVVAELPKTPTQKVRKNVVRERGVGASVWDREAAGIVVRRATS
jgi:crotonobetaine/carnitine-CoA ligase